MTVADVAAASPRVPIFFFADNLHAEAASSPETRLFVARVEIAVDADIVANIESEVRQRRLVHGYVLYGWRALIVGPRVLEDTCTIYIIGGKMPPPWRDDVYISNGIQICHKFCIQCGAPNFCDWEAKRWFNRIDICRRCEFGYAVVCSECDGDIGNYDSYNGDAEGTHLGRRNVCPVTHKRFQRAKKPLSAAALTIQEMYDAGECVFKGEHWHFTTDANVRSFFADLERSDSIAERSFLRWQKGVSARELLHVVKFMRPLPRATVTVAIRLAMSGGVRWKSGTKRFVPELCHRLTRWG